MHSPWLCKECDGECVQDISLLISNDVNTLVSEIFICEKIKRSMTLYMDFQSQRVNKVHFPSPFNNRVILSYCSVMCVVQYALFHSILFSVSLCTWRGAIFVRMVFWKCSFNGKLIDFFIMCSHVTSWRGIRIGFEGV